MPKSLELDVINIISEQKAISKEEIIIRINLERQSKNQLGLGYRAFKLVLKTLEKKSLIVRLVNNNYQLTQLGIKELETSESFLTTS